MTRIILPVFSILALSIGCGDDGTDDKKDGDASAGPSYDSICASIFEKGESDAAWKEQAEMLYTLETCPGELQTWADRWARQMDGVEAESFLPGIKDCVDSNDVFTDFNQCSSEVYQAGKE